MADKQVSKNFIQLVNVRLAFPNLWAPKGFGDNNEGDEKFSGTFIITKDSRVDAVTFDDEGRKTISKTDFDKELEKVAKGKWGDKYQAILKSIKAKDATCYHDGDSKAYDGFQGNMYVSAKSDKRPLILDRDKTSLTQQDGRPYGGCYVNASIDLYAQDNKWGKRINASLRGVQFVKDGDAFSGGTPVSDDEFDSVEDDASDLV